MKPKEKNKYAGVNSLVLPSIIIVALITQIPLLVTLVISVVKWNVVRPDQGISFVGISNYVDILSSPEFYGVVFNTASMTFVSLALCLGLGLFFAVLLNRRFAGVNIWRTLLIAPFFVMDAVAGIIWKTLILHPSFGINGVVASAVGIPPIDFLGQWPLLTIILLVVWQWTPFFFMILLAGFQSIPEEIVESAKIDGAGWAKTLFQIKIPAIAAHIEVALMLGLIFILKVFGTIYVTTAGGPGTASMNLPFMVYRTGFYRWDEGKATAMAVLTVILILLLITVIFRIIRKKTSEVES